MLEASIELRAVVFAESRGWFCRKVKFPGRRNAPDRIFAKGGRVVFVEFKKVRGIIRVGQAKEAARLLESGVEAYIIDNLADFWNVIEGRREPTNFQTERNAILSMVGLGSCRVYAIHVGKAPGRRRKNRVRAQRDLGNDSA